MRMMVAAIQVIGPNGLRSASILLNDENVREKKLATVIRPIPIVVGDQEKPEHPVKIRRIVQAKSTMMDMSTKSIHLLVSKKSLVIGRKKRGSTTSDARRKTFPMDLIFL